MDEQPREIRDDMPPGFYRRLPKLVEGLLAGYPRVYGIAWAFVAQTDSRLDSESLRRFLRANQHVRPLTTGELWAVAITLRGESSRLAKSVVRGRARALARFESGPLVTPSRCMSWREGGVGRQHIECARVRSFN